MAEETTPNASVQQQKIYKRKFLIEVNKQRKYDT